MRLNNSCEHPVECVECKDIIATTNIRFITEFGACMCFGCKRKERKPSFLTKLLRWLK